MTGPERYAFGDFELDVDERRLVKAGMPVAVPPKTFDVLAHLVRSAGRLVTKRELLERVWPDAFVEEGILSVHVSGMRKALGDDDRAPRFIETVARSGYRFVARVKRVSAPASAGVFGNWTSASAGLPAAPRHPDVYELVGRGRAHLLTHSIKDVTQAIGSYDAAVTLDPGFAAAHAGLAVAYARRTEFRLGDAADSFARAKTAALRALALDADSADAQYALAVVSYLGEWDWIGAERSLQRTLAIDPTHAEALVLYGRVLETQGRLAEGLEMKRRALEREPSSPFVHQAIALSYWHQRRYDEMIVWANRTLALDPAHLAAREHLAGAYWAMGDFDRHMEENITHAAHYGVPASTFDDMRRAYDTGGRAAVVRWVLDTSAGTLPSMQLALLHGELADMDTAMAALNRAIDARDPCLVDLAVGPQWDRLRADPRFDQCLARVGLSSIIPA